MYKLNRRNVREGRASMSTQEIPDFQSLSVEVREGETDILFIMVPGRKLLKWQMKTHKKDTTSLVTVC
jgi:hypothetical protein